MLIEIATSIKYGSYKQLRSYSENLADRILKFEDIIRQTLNLPDKIHIKLRPIRNALGTARYLISDKMKVSSIELDVRQSGKSFDNTLIHELVHAEQFYEDRLAHSDDKKWFKWHGHYYDLKSDMYRDLPWESEAYERAEYLTPIIFGYK